MTAHPTHAHPTHAHLTQAQPTRAQPTRAMVLAAGLGTRMRPLTLTTPKPLVEVAGKALLDWALDACARAGISDAVVNVHHLGEQIARHVEDRTRPHVTCVREDPVLETGGGVKNALAHLGPGPFVVANSDGLWLDRPGDVPALTRLADAWDDARMDGLLLVHDPETAFGYDGDGDFTMDGDGRLTRRGAGDTGARAFTGVQMLHPRLFADAPGGRYSLNVLYDRALAAGRLYGIEHTGEWHHVGTPAALAESDAHIRALDWTEAAP